MNESQIQAILMRWVLDKKNHVMAVPNITSVYWWECDLLSITKADITHEFEIKRTVSDYKADFTNKVAKHDRLSRAKVMNHQRLPNYFWYVTDSFEIEPPSYAGWICVSSEFIRPYDIKKVAPQLHRDHLIQRYKEAIYRNCAYKLKKQYVKSFLSVK